jgi:ankyrin repeat protein
MKRRLHPDTLLCCLWVPLISAIMAEEVAPAVRQRKASMSKTMDDTPQEQMDDAFLELCKAGDLEAVQVNIGKGQDVNVADEGGNTPVHHACLHENPEMLRALLAKGAATDHKNARGEAPISVAMCYNNVEHIKLLLASGQVDLNSVSPHNGHTLLHDAAWSGHVDVARILLQTKTFEGKMDEPNKKGQTALHIAAFRAPTEMVKLLVDHGARHDVLEKTAQWIPQDAAYVLAPPAPPAPPRPAPPHSGPLAPSHPQEDPPPVTLHPLTRKKTRRL